MHLHTAYALPSLRTGKHQDRSLDTSTESEDSRLMPRQISYPRDMSEVGWKIKHSLCRNFIDQGYCSYGERCQFAHGLEELRSNTPSNNSYKTRPCLAFLNAGYCLYGRRCNFIHINQQPLSPDKWRQIYRNFYEHKEMFRKSKKKGLMELLGNKQQ